MSKRKSSRRIVYWEDVRRGRLLRSCLRHPVTGKHMIVRRKGKKVVFTVPETGEEYVVVIKFVANDWLVDAYTKLIDEYFG